jgi:hypothetical protein
VYKHSRCSIAHKVNKYMEFQLRAVDTRVSWTVFSALFSEIFLSSGIVRSKIRKQSRLAQVLMEPGVETARLLINSAGAIDKTCEEPLGRRSKSWNRLAAALRSHGHAAISYQRYCKTRTLPKRSLFKLLSCRHLLQYVDLEICIG